MRSLILAVAIGVCVARRVPNPALDEEWAKFRQLYPKEYRDNGEELRRRTIFEENFRLIEEFNRVNASVAGFRLGVNEFADLTNREFAASYLMKRFSPKHVSGADSVFEASDDQGDLPDTVDWRTKGYVTPVKNQGACGSCWAFSTTGSLEGQVFRKTGKLVSLSEQNLVDCSQKQGNQGCNGGIMDQAFEYVKVNHGIDTEAAYPYTGHVRKCAFKADQVGATVTGYVDVKHGDEDALKEAVAKVGPVSVAIDASSIFFQLYTSGVYDPWFCSSSSLDHGVLVVGYGRFGRKDYWLVKNSWGPRWGEQGFVRMVRNKRNRCGIASMASYPTM